MGIVPVGFNSGVLPWSGVNPQCWGYAVSESAMLGSSLSGACKGPNGGGLVGRWVALCWGLNIKRVCVCVYQCLPVCVSA